MLTVLESLNQALHTAIASDERVYVLGEDITDPYGGAFKVTQGLSTAFPDRILTTPVSEAGIIGVATGMALRGLRPVVEIMFGDFVTLIADQVINHAAKFHYMYNEQLMVPIVIRVPMGGRRGYGPTHSQTLEKIFLGIPGIRVLAPCTLMDAGDLLLNAILDINDPVIFIENKVLYSKPKLNRDELADFEISAFESPDRKGPAPTYKLSIRDSPDAGITIATYGFMAELCREAMLRLAYEDEIFIDLVVFSQLSPFNIEPMIKSLQATNQLLVVEEGTYTMGWGAEILARSSETLGRKIHKAARVANPDSTIPASGPLEREVLPNTEDIIQAAKKMV